MYEHHAWNRRNNQSGPAVLNGDLICGYVDIKLTLNEKVNSDIKLILEND